SGAAGDQPSEILKVEMKQWGGNVWFPARVERSRILKDNTTVSDVIVVNRADFNSKVDESHFVIPELGIGPDTKVMDLKGGTISVWDGSKIVAAPPASTRSAEAPASGPAK